MKRSVLLCQGIIVALVLLAVFAVVFVTYAQPMENRMYDLSIVVNDDVAGPNEDMDDLGWTVFTQTGDTVTQLTHDGFGCYQSLDHPGQTFYFSRVMTEELDAATLILGTADRCFAVFLDGELIYTDCPERDNRIGYLTLPMHAWDRTSNITVTLPDDYLGKTLTIAQSTPEYGETPRMARLAMPCSVKLYCGFAYESTLIAESFRSATLGAVGYAMGAALLAIFVLTLVRNRGDVGLLFLSVSVFLSMTARLYDTSYYLQYFGIPDLISATELLRRLMVIFILAFLSTRMEGFRGLSWSLTGVCAALLLLFLLMGNSMMADKGVISFMVWHLPEIASCASLVILMGLSWFLRNKNGFHRHFAPATCVGLALWLLLQLFLPSRGEYFATLVSCLKSMTLNHLSYQLSWLVIVVSMLIILQRCIRGELDLYAEKRLLLDRSEMTRQSYENLRQHNEEVMIIRHDMNKHFQYLRSIATDEKTIRYLDGLVGQSESVRPVIECGNEMLDILIGSRAATAAAAGVKVEILRAEAPAQLPLEDADLCSLMMNLLDNAVHAARGAGVGAPVIRLDLHSKSGFFVFVCENSSSAEQAVKAIKETVPKHGLGRKIICQIVDKYSIVMQATQGESSYKVELAIPLGQSDR